MCDVLLCICYFHMLCPGSGVVLDCTISLSLPSFLLLVPCICLLMLIVIQDRDIEIEYWFKHIIHLYNASTTKAAQQ